MSNTYNNDNELAWGLDCGPLFKAIEAGYGFDVAKEIIKRLNETASNNETPDYLLVKACCDMLEMLRAKAQIAAKVYRAERGNSRHRQEISQAFKLYWLCMKLFYPMYGQAIKAAMAPTSTRFTKTVAA